MKKYLSILLVSIVMLSFSVPLCACNENTAANDTKNNDNVIKKSAIAGTCWHFNFGQTNGQQYVAKFVEDGSILGFACTNGSVKKGIYEYENGKLHLSFSESDPTLKAADPYVYHDIDFVECEDGYRSAEKIGMMVGEDYYRITPIDDSEFDEYYDKYAIPKCDFANHLMSGSWYSYSTQAADCYEYVFQDDATVWIRYRDFMTSDGDYNDYLDDLSRFTIDENEESVTIGSEDEGVVWHYDEDKDILFCETYYGPGDEYLDVYLVHYDDVPTTEMIDRDRAIYASPC